MLVAVMTTGSLSASVTPKIEIGTILWLGGHRSDGPAVAAEQSGGVLPAGGEFHRVEHARGSAQ